MKRVVITGLGVLAPQGNTVASFWDKIVNGVNGATTVTRFDAAPFRTHMACEVKGFNGADYMDKAELKRTDLFTQYALAASEQAIKDSGFELDKMSPFDVGVIWGTGQGGMQTFEEQVVEYAEQNFVPRFSPFFVPKLVANMASGMISIRHGYMGINYTAVSACATSNSAIMDAFNYIRWGKAKIIVTGGSEAPITRASFGGFCAMKAMSVNNNNPEAASRPFDVERDGFVMGEGAGALVLEEYEHAVQRGATIYGELAGAAMTADAYHMTAPHPEGLGALQGMKLALQDGGLNVEDLDYINAHATSTPVGDLSEIKALSTLLGSGKNNVQISATKSMTGHLLGAAGAIEAIISLMAIRDGIVPPTTNTTKLDETIPGNLNIVIGSAIEKKMKVALSNTFGFGGHNGIVIFKSI